MKKQPLQEITRTLMADNLHSASRDRPEDTMPDKDLSEIICIIDRNGSMERIRNDAIGGFNAFLDEQKELQTINRMISDRHENHAWEFAFLAADQDAIAAAGSLGIAHAASFAATPAGVAGACTSLSKVVSGFRAHGKVTEVDDSDLQ